MTTWAGQKWSKFRRKRRMINIQETRLPGEVCFFFFLGKRSISKLPPGGESRCVAVKFCEVFDILRIYIWKLDNLFHVVLYETELIWIHILEKRCKVNRMLMKNCYCILKLQQVIKLKFEILIKYH